MIEFIDSLIRNKLLKNLNFFKNLCWGSISGNYLQKACIYAQMSNILTAPAQHPNKSDTEVAHPSECQPCVMLCGENAHEGADKTQDWKMAESS